MTQFRTQAAVAQSRAQSQHQLWEAKCLEEVYEAFPKLIRCTATSKMVLESIYQFMGRTDIVPTLELFKTMLDANPEYFQSSLASDTIPNRRAQLINDIIELMEGSGTKYSQHNLSSERSKMSAWTVQALESHKANLGERIRLKKFSAGELRQQLAADRAANAPRRPVLPAEYTAAVIKTLPPEGIKNLIKRFSVVAVNDRLFGRS